MAEPTSPVAATDYFDLTQVADVAVSSSGDHVAFVAETPADERSYDAAVYVASVESGTVERYTQAEGSYTEPAWSPSGDRLAYVSSRGPSDRSQVWVASLDDGESRQLTTGVGGASSIAWSPDGDRIAFVQWVTNDDRAGGLDLDAPPDYERAVPDPNVIDRTVYRGRGDGWYYDRWKQVYVVGVADGDVNPVTEGNYDYKQPDWGDDSTLYYAAKRTGDPDDNQVHDVIRHDLESGTEAVLTRTSARSPRPKATEDGRVAFVFAPNTELEDPDDPGPKWHKPNLQVYHPDSEALTMPTASVDREVYGKSIGAPFAWGPDGSDLYFLTPDAGCVEVRRVPADAGEGADVETVLGEDDVHIRGFDVAGDTLAVVRSEWDRVNDVYVSDLDGGQLERLAAPNDDYLAGVTVNRPEEVWFESDDVDVQGWLLTPDSPPGDDGYPLAVNIHGGPIHMWTTSGTMWHEFQLLAARGYAVFWCNPRGSSGYGESFMSALAEDYRGGGPYYRDLMAGVDVVSQEESIDETDMFVLGGSFGGLMTAWVIARTDRFKAAVAQRGVYDEIAQYGAKDTYNSPENLWGVPWENHDGYWAVSPISAVGDADTPTLLMHSEEDYRVTIHNAELLYRALSKLGVDTRFVRYPREGHGLSRSGEPAHVVDRLERIVRWFDGYSAHHDVPLAVERGDDGLTYPSSLGK